MMMAYGINWVSFSAKKSPIAQIKLLLLFSKNYIFLSILFLILQLNYIFRLLFFNVPILNFIKLTYAHQENYLCYVPDIPPKSLAKHLSMKQPMKHLCKYKTFTSKQESWKFVSVAPNLTARHWISHYHQILVSFTKIIDSPGTESHKIA